MAYSDNVTVSSGGYTFIIYYTYEQNQYSNSSTITVSKITFQSTNYYVGGQSAATYFKGLTVTFAGQSILTTSSNKQLSAYVKTTNTPYEVSLTNAYSISGTVGHDHNGAKSGTFNLSTTLSGGGMGGDSSFSGTSGTKSLNTITPLYTITYDKGDYGIGENTSDIKTYGIAIKLKGALFTRSGYKQTGWSKNSDGSTKDWELEEDFVRNQSKTFYPYWEASAAIHISNGTTITDCTNLYFSDGTNIYNIIGYYYSDGVSTHQGI